jgi:hypothetical protein
MPDPPKERGDHNLLISNGFINMANNDGSRKLPIMVRQPRKSQNPVWPFMQAWGLYRKPIEADGMSSVT